MPKSLLEQLPEIVKRGRDQAEKILESLEGRHRVDLQTREWVLPARDSRATDWSNPSVRQGESPRFPWRPVGLNQAAMAA